MLVCHFQQYGQKLTLCDNKSHTNTLCSHKENSGRAWEECGDGGGKTANGHTVEMDEQDNLCSVAQQGDNA